MTSSESQSRGVDLPVTKTTVDTSTPQKETAPDNIQQRTSSSTTQQDTAVEEKSASQSNNTYSNNPKMSFGNFVLGTVEIIVGPIVGSFGAALMISGFFPASPTVGWGIPTGFGLATVGYGLIDNGLNRLSSGEVGLPDTNWMPPGWPY